MRFLVLALLALALPRPSAAEPLLFQPHYDLNTVGQYWALDPAGEDAVIPRVVRLSLDPGGFYYPAANGAYLVFVRPEDAGRLAGLPAGSLNNLAAFLRGLDPIAAAIDESLRAENYYLIKDSDNAIIQFSPTDIATGRVVYHGSFDPSGDFLEYYDALHRFYYLEETGMEAGPLIYNPEIVPLKKIEPSLSATWVSPSDGGTKTGLCYLKFVSKKWYAFECYKPTSFDDPEATRFVIYSATDAEQMNLYKTTLGAWREARAAINDKLNGHSLHYCYNTTMEIWGDAPYASWYFDSLNRPLYDSAATAAVPIYGSTVAGALCTTADPGAITVGIETPSDTEIKIDLWYSLPLVSREDVLHIPYIDEFYFQPGGFFIDRIIKGYIHSTCDYWCAYYQELDPSYVCHPCPIYWPSDMLFFDPWYMGFFDHLYYEPIDDPYYEDADGDGMGDIYEANYPAAGLDPFVPGNADADPDGDGRDNLAEFWDGTDPCTPDDADYDHDGLGDTLEISIGTDQFFWDSDFDSLPDGYEYQNSSGHDLNLNPLDPDDGALDFDDDGNPNVHEYWNGSDPWTPDPIGQAGCYFWGEGDGDGLIGPGDIGMLQSVIKNQSVSYAGVIPPTGETSIILMNGFVGPGDLSILQQIIKGETILDLPSRPMSLTRTEPTFSWHYLGGVDYGATVTVAVEVNNAAGQHTPGIGVVFEIDPASTGTAVLLGGDGAFGNGRFDFSDSIADGRAAITVRAGTSGVVYLNARLLPCGSDLDDDGQPDPDVGRYCAGYTLAPAVEIIVR